MHAIMSWGVLKTIKNDRDAPGRDGANGGAGGGAGTAGHFCTASPSHTGITSRAHTASRHDHVTDTEHDFPVRGDGQAGLTPPTSNIQVTIYIHCELYCRVCWILLGGNLGPARWFLTFPSVSAREKRSTLNIYELFCHSKLAFDCTFPLLTPMKSETLNIYDVFVLYIFIYI